MTEKQQNSDKATTVRQRLRWLLTHSEEMTITAAELDSYIAAQLAGENTNQRYPEIAARLDTSPTNAAAYARLFELERAAESLPQPAAIPAPDLSFLHGQPSLLQTLREAVGRAAGAITLEMSQALVGLLQPPQVAAALRGGGDGRYGEVLLQLTVEQAAAATLPFTLIAYRDAAQTGMCLIEVTVEPEGKSWPDLAGSQVTLRWGAEAQTAETDAWGTAPFANVPQAALADLIIGVETAA